MKFCCVVAMRVVVASVLLYIWNIFGNLVVIFFFFLFGTRGELFFYDLIPGEKVLFVEKFFRGLSRG